MSKVSIIVPCYNSAKFLISTIQSVINQDNSGFSDWELILINDESKDETWQIIEHFIHLDKRITGYTKKNGGTCDSRNFGFSKASPKSKYLFFLDHDDQLENNALLQMSSYMDLHDEVGLLGCQFRDVSEDGQLLATGKRSRWVPGLIVPRELRDYELETPFVTFFCATGQGPFAMYRRSVYESTEGWEVTFWPHEDTDMFCQMALISKVHFLPNPFYLKRVHPAQGMNDWPRLQHSYCMFREKWDNRHPKSVFEAEMIQSAKRHYYFRHRPFRDLKVAQKTLNILIQRPNPTSTKWFLKLTINALSGFIAGKAIL